MSAKPRVRPQIDRPQEPQQERRASGGKSAADLLRRQLPLIAAVLDKALQRDGCVLCRALEDVESRSIFAFLYEGMTMPATREGFVKAGGFCPRHFRMALQQTRATGYVGPFEIASLCQSLLARTRDHIRRVQGGKWSVLHKRDAIRAPSTPGEDCIFCRESRDREKDLVLALESLISDPAVAATVRTRDFCQRHAGLAIQQWKGEQNRVWLGEVVTEQMAKLQSGLAEFLRQYDYQFRNERVDADSGAVERAISFLLGLEAPKTSV